MTATIHHWANGPTDPIVTLTSELNAVHPAEWSDETDKRFKSGAENILKLQVRFLWRKPPNGMPRYIVMIERQSGTGWINVIRDEVVLVVDYNANNVNPSPGEADEPDNQPYLKEYSLWIPTPVFLWRDRTVRFRISTMIGHGGSLPTDVGSPPGWFDPETQEFTAIFERPTLSTVEAHVVTLESALREGLREYRMRPPR